MIIKYFGNKKDSINREILENYRDKFDSEKLINFKEKLNYKNLILLRQTHSIIGHIINNYNVDKFLNNNFEGDYLIIDLPGIAIGVYTADCLPIIIYDNKNKVIAIVHAGWPGSVGKVAVKALRDMQDNFKSNLEDLEIYFGPSAKVCCYEVTDEFKDKLREYNFIGKVLIKRSGKLFFDLPGFNILLLQEAGIKKEQINLENNLCTICDNNFCSFRRDKNNFRQLNIAFLK